MKANNNQDQINNMLKAQAVGQTVGALLLLAVLIGATMCGTKREIANRDTTRKIEKAAPLRSVALGLGQHTR